MTGLSITDIILGGVALASLAWMFRHLVLKTDKSVDSLTSKQEEFTSTQGEHVERLAIMDTKVEQHDEQIRLLRKDVKYRFDKMDERFDKMDDRFDRVDARMDKGFAEVRELLFRFLAPDQKAPQQPSNPIPSSTESTESAKTGSSAQPN